MRSAIASNKSPSSLALLLLWLALAVAGLISSPHLNERLTTSLQIPNSNSARVEGILQENFRESSEGTFSIIYTFKNLSPEALEQLKVKINKSSEILPGSRVVQQRALAGTLYTLFVSDLSLNEASKYVAPIREALKGAGLDQAIVTGPAAVAADSNPLLKKDLQRGQVIALLISIGLLIAAFGFSFLALLPLIFALLIVFVTIFLLYLLSFIFPLMLYTPNLVELFGFGLALDFAILLGARLRNRNDLNEQVISHSLSLVSRTVRYSAISIALGLLTLIAVDIPFIRSIGVALLVLPCVLLAGIYGFIPALLKIGGKHLYGCWKFAGLLAIVEGKKENRTFESGESRSIRRAALTLLCGAALLVPLLSQLPKLQITPSALTAIPTTVESGRALASIGRQVGSGVVTPHIVIADFHDIDGASRIGNKAKVSELVGELSTNKEVFAIATDETPTYLDSTGRYQRIFIFTRSALGEQESRKFATALRERLSALNSKSSDGKVHFLLGGAPAQGEDLLSALKRELPWKLPIIIIALMLYLIVVFRSVLLPIVALILDLLSLLASLGVLAFLLDRGLIRGEFGMFQSSALEVWVLLFLGVVLFGLSMDYEIFLLSRVSEEREGSAGLAAIDSGVRKTRGVIVLAALIMVGSVSGLSTSDFPVLAQMGVGLTIGILLDVLLVRLFLLPALMKLLHRWMWWFPVKNRSHR